MADSFKSKLAVTLPEGVGLWDAVQHLGNYAHNLLKGLPGKVHGHKFTLVDEHNSRIDRQSIAELRSAVQQHRLEPNHVIAQVNLTPPGKLQWHDNLAITVWGYFPGTVVGELVFVTFESGDKIQMDGVRAQMEREAQHLDNISSGELLTVAETPKDPPDRPGEITAVPPSLSSDPAPFHEDTRSWLARTWRDHTAVFIVTVSGGLVVVTVALWLGLTP